MPKRSIAALSTAIVFLIFDTPLALTTPVKVVATLPILKEFAEQVGREHVQVTSLISGFESEHSYSPKPSDLKAIGEARLLLEIGLGLEVWVGGLVKNAANPRLRVVTTSHDIAIIRDASEPNSPGNPHIWLDPENAKITTGLISTTMSNASPIPNANCSCLSPRSGTDGSSRIIRHGRTSRAGSVFGSRVISWGKSAPNPPPRTSRDWLAA